MEEHPADESAVRAALDRILASEAFASTARMSRLLRFVVERSLEGRADEIKEYVLGTEVFDRGPDYDPRLDSIVRVEARRLRTKLDEYYAGPGADDPVLIRIKRGTYVPEFVMRATAPEPAPVVARTTAVAIDKRRPRRRSILWAGATLGALAVAAIAAQIAGSRGPTSAASVPRLAVLPLAPDAPGDNDRALATRLTEGITAALVRADGLAIVSSTSAARFDREPRDVREVAQALDADWLVEGSVFVDGDRVRVAARLVDPSRNQKVWAEDFEGEMAALRDLERQVAKGVDEAARSRRRD